MSGLRKSDSRYQDPVLARERKLAFELIFGESLSGLASIVYFRGIYPDPRRLDERPIVPHVRLSTLRKGLFMIESAEVRIPPRSPRLRSREF
jgi:hypothetical protein